MPVKKPSTSRKCTKRPSKPTPKAKAAYRSEMSKNFKILFIVIAAIIGIGLLVQGVWWFNQYNETVDGQKKIEAYLEEKYDQDFVVERPTHIGYGFAIEGVLESVAYPKDNPSLKFFATTNSRGNSDEYPDAVWTQEETASVESFLKTVFGTVPDFDFTINANAAVTGKIKGRVPNFEGIRASQRENLAYVIHVKVNDEFNTKTEQQHFDRVVDLAKYVKAQNVGKPQIKYTVNLTNENARYVCNLSGEELNGIITGTASIRECFTKYQGRG